MNKIYPPAREFVAAVTRLKLAKVRVAQRLTQLKIQTVEKLLKKIS